MDGTGLSPVADDDLADKLLAKTNDLNDGVFVRTLIPVLLYAALPLDTVRSLVGGAVVFAGLFVLADLRVGIDQDTANTEET